MKRILKSIVIAIFYILMLPLGLTAIITYKLFGTQVFFLMFAEFLSMIPSFPGYFSRGCYYQMTLTEAHVDLFTAFGTYISKIESKIGKNVIIGGRTTIGLAEIGENTAISNYVSILSGSRQHNFTNPEESIFATEENFVRVKIGQGVFIGDQTIVMANIGDKTIIGAGSIIVKDIPSYSVAVGNPAKVIKSRK